MPNGKLPISPKTGLIVPISISTSETERSVLQKLYLPLIGPLAFSLYFAFKNFETEIGSQMQYYNHSDLLKILNVDLSEIVAARRRLEATGLLRSYFHEDSNGAAYLYRLKSPMTASDFFKDDLLSVLLLDVVGETAYQRLSEEFTEQSLDLSAATEVTANLLDVFHISSEKIIVTPDSVKEVRDKLEVSNVSDMTSELLADEKFDWSFLGQILKNNYVNLEDVSKNRDLIITESRLYGLDELQIAKEISEIANLTDGHFDPKKLKIQIAKKYDRSTVSMMSDEQRKSLHEDAKNKIDEQNKQISKEYNDNVKILVKLATETPPIQFLEQIKYEKGGNATANERFAVEGLINNTTLTNSVINMLIYYLLMNEEMSTLNKRLLDTIADNWQQAKLATPQDVLKHLKKRDERRKKDAETRKEKRQTNQRGRRARKEIVPDWAKKSAKKQTGKANNQLSEAQRKQLAEQIKNMDDN